MLDNVAVAKPSNEVADGIRYHEDAVRPRHAGCPYHGMAWHGMVWLMRVADACNVIWPCWVKLAADMTGCELCLWGYGEVTGCCVCSKDRLEPRASCVMWPSGC